MNFHAVVAFWKDSITFFIIFPQHAVSEQRLTGIAEAEKTSFSYLQLKCFSSISLFLVVSSLSSFMIDHRIRISTKIQSILNDKGHFFLTNPNSNGLSMSEYFISILSKILQNIASSKSYPVQCFYHSLISSKFSSFLSKKTSRLFCGIGDCSPLFHKKETDRELFWKHSICSQVALLLSG